LVALMTPPLSLILAFSMVWNIPLHLATIPCLPQLFATALLQKKDLPGLPSHSPLWTLTLFYTLCKHGLDRTGTAQSCLIHAWDILPVSCDRHGQAAPLPHCPSHPTHARLYTPHTPERASNSFFLTTPYIPVFSRVARARTTPPTTLPSRLTPLLRFCCTTFAHTTRAACAPCAAALPTCPGAPAHLPTCLPATTLPYSHQHYMYRCWRQNDYAPT